MEQDMDIFCSVNSDRIHVYAPLSSSYEWELAYESHISECQRKWFKKYVEYSICKSVEKT